MVEEISGVRTSLRAPRAAAVAGILFSVLFIASYVLVWVSIPANPEVQDLAVISHSKTISLALNLLPSAGIAFLWSASVSLSIDVQSIDMWLVLGKAFRAAAKYLYAEETGIDDTDFRILEALLNKGPLPVNTIGPKVNLTRGSISTAVDRLVKRGLVGRVESPKDRRVRIVSLTAKAKN